MELKKVTKSQVRAQLKRLKSGESLVVCMLPSNVRPGGMWLGNGFGGAYTSEGFRHTNEGFRTFQEDIDAYAYYNCNNELGNRVHFYIEA